MTKFQTILARLCAASGCTMLHMDSPGGLIEAIGDEGRDLLVEAIGVDGLATLADDQEIQLIVPGTPSDAEATGHIRMMRAIKALIAIEGSSVMLVTGSGKVSTWEQGGTPGIERLDGDLLTEAMVRRANNGLAAAA